MVEGKPYVNFKIINERVARTVDTNYLWATTVEAKKDQLKFQYCVKMQEKSRKYLAWT